MSAVLGRFYAGQARHRLGLDDLKACRYESAAGHFRRALDHNPKASGLGRYLATCYVGMRDYKRAADAFTGVLRDHPGAEEVRIQGALSLSQVGRIDEAIAMLREGIETSPAEPELHYQLGLMFAACERYEEAITQLTTADALRPDHPATQLRLAWCYAALQNAQKALALIEQAYRLRPYDPEIAMHLALAARAAREVEPDVTVTLPATENWSPPEVAVMDELLEVVSEDPDFVEAMLGLEQTDVDRQVFRMLAGTLEAALSRNAEYADLHYHVARVYERLGEPDRAIEASQRAVKINPRFTEALIHLGRLYAATHREADAIDRLEVAIERGADYPDVHYLLGNLYRDTGQAGRARQEYHRALRLNGNYPDAQSALASLGT